MKIRILKESMRKYSLEKEIGADSDMFKQIADYMKTKVSKKEKVSVSDLQDIIKERTKTLLYYAIAQKANFSSKNHGKKTAKLLTKMIMAQKKIPNAKAKKRAQEVLDKEFPSKARSLESKYDNFKYKETSSRTWNFVQINKNKSGSKGVDAHKLYLSLAYDLTPLESITDENALSDVYSALMRIYLVMFFSMANALAEMVEKDPDVFTSRIEMKMGALGSTIMGYNDTIIIYASTDSSDKSIEVEDLKKAWPVISKKINDLNSWLKSHKESSMLNMKMLTPSERKDMYSRPTLGRDTDKDSDTTRFIENFGNNLTKDEIVKLCLFAYKDEKDKFNDYLFDLLDAAMESHLADLGHDKFGF